MHLSQLWIYPVKSLQGIDLAEAEVTPRGFRHDRRWMIVDAAGLFITQRTIPALARIATALEPEALVLSTAGQSVRIPFTTEGEPQRVQVWRDEVEALAISPEADAFLSEFLGTSCRLVWMPETTHRQVDLTYAQPGDITGFSDGFPFLIVGQASLDELNSRLDEPVPMNRFRPNLVVEGSAPFAEDTWRHLQIGDIPFEIVKPCSRCTMTTTDQISGDRQSPEPLRTLALFRNFDGKVMFGQNALPRATGPLRLGDRVQVTPANP